jgi:hypothetical protein
MKGFKKVAVANVGGNVYTYKVILNIPFVLSVYYNNHFLVKVASVPGIMARDSQTVVTVTKLLLNDNHLQIHGDPDLLPIPWNEKVFFALELFDFINFSL